MTIQEQQIENFEKGIHNMFDHIWECEIEHPVFNDTVGDLMRAVIQLYKTNVGVKEKPAELQMPEICQKCSNHPSNGGNGLCKCLFESKPRINLDETN